MVEMHVFIISNNYRSDTGFYQTTSRQFFNSLIYLVFSETKKQEMVALYID